MKRLYSQKGNEQVVTLHVGEVVDLNGKVSRVMNKKKDGCIGSERTEIFKEMMI